MDTMKNFFSSFTFLVGFMVLCIFMQMLFGAKMLNKFLWLVLFGMIITNVDNFTAILKKAGKADTVKATKDNDGSRLFMDSTLA